MNLLLEIGAEEIPDWMLAGALEYLGAAVGDLLKQHQLGGSAIRTDATPRRLVVRAKELAARQDDSSERIWGPGKFAPAAALDGFAKKQGIEREQLELVSDGKVEKYTTLRTIAGRPASEILAEALPQLILKTPFPKTMYWTGKGGDRFIRPIRWVVALLDDQVIPFTVAGVTSGNESSGHRRLGAARIPVTCLTYEPALRANYVMLSADERKAKIRAVPTKYKCDNELLSTLVNLTEWPTPITGSFDPAFLDLPKEVLITVMRFHQKYFPVETADGALAPQFVAVTNTDGDPDGLIVRGNERVLRARFNDARFFWDTDQKRKLSERIKDLGNVTFQAKLGTYLEKADRMDQLVIALLVYAAKPGEAVTANDIREAKGRYAFGPDSPEFYAVRASRLSKTDLTTELVKEFTELQGIVGGLYARVQGEAEEVATAIYDHYKPVSMEDAIPRTLTGRLVAIADKLDTLRGCFRVGLIPSGSKDPFALRRAAQGIVKILAEGKLRLPIQSLCEGDSQLEEFMAERVRYYFRDIRGYKYDEVNAVMASGWNDLLDVEERLAAVREIRPTENFEPLAASFKRIRNILKQAQFEGGSFLNTGTSLQEKLLERGAETELYLAFKAAQVACRLLPDHLSRLDSISSLRPKVDVFFEKTMVNAEDPAIRQNRLTLLHMMLAEFSQIADFSEIITGTVNTKNQETK